MYFKTVRIGTRGSKLALWQAHHIADLLQHSVIQTEVVVINTKGDQIMDVSLSKIGSKGVFTEELEQALRNGDIDIAQHSAKDLQSHLPDDLELIAFTQREKANDVVLSFDKNFSLLSPNKKIGTSSVRRMAFFKKYYPHLTVVDLRGNLQTRIEKLKNGAADALALAFAGVHRMGFEHLIVEILPLEQFTAPVGQGSVAIEASKNLPKSLREHIRSAVNDPETETCLVAERAFLATLNGGCSIPAFCFAELKNGKIHLRGGLVSLDGKKEIVVERNCELHLGAETGIAVAGEILSTGGKELLTEIRERQKQ